MTPNYTLSALLIAMSTILFIFISKVENVIGNAFEGVHCEE